MFWKSQFCPFHLCPKVVQCVMEPIILYYLPLLPWTKKALHSVSQPLQYLVWRKRDNMRITQVAQNHLATPTRLGRVAKLDFINAYNRMQVFINERPVFILTTIDTYCPIVHFITHGRTTIKASWWQLFIGCIQLKTPQFSFV